MCSRYGKYDSVNHFLLRRFSLSTAERVDKLLNLPGLGGKSAVDLMDIMLSLLGCDNGGFLFIHLFLQQLPQQVRAALTISPQLAEGNYHGLAKEVDEALRATRGHVAPAQQLFSAVPAVSIKPRCGSSSLCSYHRRFGSKAKRCIPLCMFEMSGGTGAGPMERVDTGNGGELVMDSRSGCRFLIDSGSQKSILCCTGQERSSSGCGPPLSAAKRFSHWNFWY